MRTLYRNGRLHSRSVSAPGSVLVDDAVIVAVGEVSDAGADRLVELGGALVTPAFVDAHVHATSTGLALSGLDLSRAGSREQVLEAVAREARVRRGRPILGGGWDDSAWADQRPPTARELDRAAYGGAVYLARVDAHSAVVSSALLGTAQGLAGWSVDGWLRRQAHDAARTAAFEALGGREREQLQRTALQHAAALGIACVHEMAGPAISSAEDLAGLLALAAAEPLPEVVGYWGELGAIDTAIELGAAGAAGDLFCDGSLGSHTAALHEPYTDAPDTVGMLRFDTADVAEHIERCERAGIASGFHAIGDAAVDQVLDAAELAGRRLGRLPARARIEHAEFVREPERLAASGLHASVQPMFDAAWGGPDGMYAARLGATRAAALNRYADLAAAGVPLAFGSDAPVTELGPWAAVRAAVRPAHGGPGLSPAAAFEAHTLGGWRIAGRRGSGSLAPGRPATFAVWAVEATTPDGLPDIDGPDPRCLATVRDGLVLHDAGVGNR